MHHCVYQTTSPYPSMPPIHLLLPEIPQTKATSFAPSDFTPRGGPRLYPNSNPRDIVVSSPLQTALLKSLFRYSYTACSIARPESDQVFSVKGKKSKWGIVKQRTPSKFYVQSNRSNVLSRKETELPGMGHVSLGMGARVAWNRGRTVAWIEWVPQMVNLASALPGQEKKSSDPVVHGRGSGWVGVGYGWHLEYCVWSVALGIFGRCHEQGEIARGCRSREPEKWAVEMVGGVGTRGSSVVVSGYRSGLMAAGCRPTRVIAGGRDRASQMVVSIRWVVAPGNGYYRNGLL